MRFIGISIVHRKPFSGKSRSALKHSDVSAKCHALQNVAWKWYFFSPPMWEDRDVIIPFAPFTSLFTRMSWITPLWQVKSAGITPGSFFTANQRRVFSCVCKGFDPFPTTLLGPCPHQCSKPHTIAFDPPFKEGELNIFPLIRLHHPFEVVSCAWFSSKAKPQKWPYLHQIVWSIFATFHYK